ncbi:MAG: EamA family transporter [Nocardioidaceae bacterium]
MQSTVATREGYAGLGLALTAGATFGLSGSFGTSLLDVGWSPLGVVFGRLLGAAVLLCVPLAVVVARGWRPRRAHVRSATAYGIFAVAGTQLCFFSAIQYLSVGVALLLEFLAPVLLLGWAWWRTGRPPAPRTLAGAAVAIAGLVLVLDVAGDATIQPLGVLWGLGAALCVCVFFQTSAGEDSPPPLVLTASGMAVGAAVVGVIGVVGLLPFDFDAADTSLAGRQLPWWAILLLLAGVSTVVAYVCGIMAIARLGPRIASFVGLSEVLFAVLGAWWLVGERPTLSQLVGGILVVGGIAIIRYAERASRVEPARARRADSQALP